MSAARVTAREPVAYDPFLPGRSVERLAGEAEVGAGEVVTWSVIVKETRSKELRAAKRELAAYRQGMARHGSLGVLSAPVLIASRQVPGSVDLLLEELVDEHAGAWPLERYGLAARHIARWDAQMRSVLPGCGFDTEDAWAELHGQPHRVEFALEELRTLRKKPHAEELMIILDDHGFDRTREMIEATGSRVEALGGFPQVLMHHDLVRSNLFAVTGSQTAAIDWESVGPGPLGVDLAPLVVGSVGRGDASSDDLPQLERLVLINYEQVVTEAGADATDVRAAYRLALGLRWHRVLGTIRVWLDPNITGMRGSRRSEPREEGLRHLVALSKHLLDATCEA